MIVRPPVLPVVPGRVSSGSEAHSGAHAAAGFFESALCGPAPYSPPALPSYYRTILQTYLRAPRVAFGQKARFGRWRVERTRFVSTRRAFPLAPALRTSGGSAPIRSMKAVQQVRAQGVAFR